MRRSTVGFKWWGQQGWPLGKGSQSSRGQRRRVQPALMDLEERRLLSTYIVTDNSDNPSDPGSLRATLASAPAGATINFATSVTSPIVLTNGVLNIAENVTIVGPSSGLTINGDNKGAIFSIYSGVTAAISNLTITDGSDSGVYNDGTLLTMTDCAISGNTSSGHGGGIYNLGDLDLTDCTVSSDNAGSSDYGGGLYNDNIATLTGCTFSFDTAGEFGGGVYNNFSLQAYNSTFADNTAKNGYYGGGLYNNDDNAFLVSCTFTSNTAAFGGGLYCNLSPIMWNTIVAGNTGTSGAPDVYGTVYSGGAVDSVGGHNFIGNTAGSSGWGSSDQINKSSPDLAGLAFYGGPTATVALQPGSPAIGNGITEFNVTTDQRGFLRPSQNPDIGAFQTLSGAEVVNTTAGTASVPSGDLSLSAAVNLANSAPVSHTITFDSSVFATAQTITLASGPLDFNNTHGTQTINGPTAALSVSGGGNSQVFKIDAGVTASLSALTITGGNSMGSDGGGLVNSGNLTLNNCLITGNTASTIGTGGGLENYGSATLTNCVLSGNSAGNEGGGLAGNGMTTLVNCAVTDNNAGAGGGLFMSGKTTLTGCTLSGNTASGIGGGLDMSAGTSTLINCTVAGNSADGGGGVYNDGSLSLTNCTVTGNSGGAKGGGGLFNAGNSATLTNTIVAGNTNGSAAPSDIGGGINVSGTYNLIGTGGSGGLTNGVGGNIVGVASPGLASLAYYGGPTQTVALLPGSPAIGKGTKVAGVTTDQRGFPLDSPVDIGAFQVDSNVLAVNTPFEGSGVPSGALDLAAAVRLADLEPGSHTMTFDPKVFATPQTITLTSGELELSNTSGTQTITGPAAGVTIKAAAASRVFQVDGGVTASLSGLTITGGSADQGGDLLNFGTLTLTNCTLSGGKATKDGGGIASLGMLTMTGCTVTGSNASNNGGGIASYAQATLTNCTLSSNGANMGGGLFSTSTLILTGCTVTENGATQDGGLFSAGGANLTNCSITQDYGNQAGGLGNAGMMTLTNCTISGNSAVDGSGGAIVNNGTLTLTNSTLSKNGVEHDGNGGAIANYGKATLTNCTVSGNSLGSDSTFPGNGGGVENSAVGTVSFIDCTLSANSATKGGGLYNLGTATLTDTIVAGNRIGPTGAPSDIAGSSRVAGIYNLIGTGGSGGLTNGLNGNIVGVADPGLDSLGSYGGPTQTMALLAGSPAIGKGTSVSGVTTDQRGMARGASVDIGAYQYSLVVESPAGPVDTVPAELTLTGAVSLANSFAGPVAITFDPAVFTGKQTITLTGNGSTLKLESQVPLWTITTQGLTAGSSITINGSIQVFQVETDVTAHISGLTIEPSTSYSVGIGLTSDGDTTLTNCQFIGPAQASGFEGIDVEGGTLNVSQSQVTGWNTGILVRTGTATITHSTIAGNGMGIDNIGADSAVTAQYDDLANNTFAGIYNGGAPQIAATYNWWGSSGGPASPGGSPARGNINFSPWLGDSQSLNLTTPDSLGFNSTGSDSYTVTPIASGPILQVSLANASWSVTPAGTVVFTGNGGGVTISGESKTNAFTLTNAAVTFAAGDVFNGATIQFNGSIGREIDAKGRINSFDVSGFTGAATLTAPSAGTVSTVLATKNAGYTLTNTSLSSTDGMNLTLRGMTTANLTANTSSGKPTVIVDASAFSGVTNLTAGGAGNAILYGGGSQGKANTLTLNSTATGNDILIGGPGANTLTDDGSGKNILIGGGGPNTITGNGNDILLTGVTVYNANSAANIAALDAILAEWSSTDAYGVRISKITNGITVGSNTYGLNRNTVHSNRQSNTVSDGPMQSEYQNWFIVNSSDAVTQKDETVTVINT